LVNRKLALALSGGGAKGAFTAGVIQHLLDDQNMDFELAVGTSTGSLVAGPAVLGDGFTLEERYTSVKNKDIYINSFMGGILNFFDVYDGPLDAKMTPLYNNLIDYYLARKNLEKLINMKNKEFVVTIVNARTGLVHFVSSNEVKNGTITSETFVKAILASCCEPVFTKPVKVFENEAKSIYRNDLFYDGGLKEFLPIEHAVSLGGTEVWAISTHPLTAGNGTSWGGGDPNKINLFNALAWTVDSLLTEVARGDRFRAELYFRWDNLKEEIIKRAIDCGLSKNAAETLFDNLPISADPTEGLSLPDLKLISPDRSLGASLKFDPSIMTGFFTEGQLRAEKHFKDGNQSFSDKTLRPWDKII